VTKERCGMSSEPSSLFGVHIRLYCIFFPSFENEACRGLGNNLLEETGLDPNYRLVTLSDMANEMLSLFLNREAKNP
jgi:hypothetical protein